MAELKKLETDKLHAKLAELRNKSRELKFSIANNQLKAVRQLRSVKQDIARILTILNDKTAVKSEPINQEEKK